MPSNENPQSPAWTYRMEVSPAGQSPQSFVPNVNDPVALLQVLINLQTQSLEIARQSLELQRQHLELTRESVLVAREQRTRQFAELERWQSGHEPVIESCREALRELEQVHATLMGELAEYVHENHDNLLDGDFALSDFVDKFGPRLAHLNTMLAVLRPLTANLKKTES